ncbi:MAG TPA: hypothetical protein VH165_33965 [Kofleriaceae bacterium]|nr:hypothetical protein [Kofleriaceae bacterium]
MKKMTFPMEIENGEAIVGYLAVLPMNNRKTTKRTVATPDLDPAALAHLNVLKRQRQRMNRALLKRRRRKSGQ